MTNRRPDRGLGARAVRAWVVVVALALVGAACTAGGDASPTPVASSSSSPEPVTVNLWAYWTGRELKEFSAMFDRLKEQKPWITVNVTGGVDDKKINAAINSGTPPDVAVSSDMNNIPVYCSSGAWQDLSPWLEQDQVQMDQFPPSAGEFTQWQGTRCAMPFTADSYGLYINDDLFSQAGIQGPPKTWTELEADAKQLTQFNADGSIKVAGFVPWFGYYETNPVTLGVPSGAHWYDDAGASSLGSDPAWRGLLTWQRDFIANVYGGGDFGMGSEALSGFVAGQGDEFSASQDFETGRVAMNLDGEWRVAFIENEHPDLAYSTAPFPVPDAKADSYGIGQVALGIIGIPRGAAQADAAWDVIDYMATDTQNLVYLGNVVRNLPTTFAAIASPDLKASAQFQTFLDIYTTPGSTYKQTSIIGAEDVDMFSGFLEKWQAGSVDDLEAGLQDTATQIDQAIEQAQAP
jgi:multiple sugar transport system substrate-binding protein